MVEKLIGMRVMTFWCLIWAISIIAVFYSVYALHNRWMTIVLPATFIFPAIGSARQWNYDFKHASYAKKRLMVKELKEV